MQMKGVSYVRSILFNRDRVSGERYLKVDKEYIPFPKKLIPIPKKCFGAVNEQKTYCMYRRGWRPAVATR